MKALRLLAGCVVAAAVIGVGPAGAQQATAATGGIQMTMHTHSSGTTRFGFDRLAFDLAEGDEFAYSSRLCSGSAPFNDLALDFNPDYPGVDDDADGRAPVRHQIAGTITEINGDTGRVEGTITTVLCTAATDGTQLESAGDMVVTNFEARFRLVSDNELQIMGTFHISPEESTGVFAGLEGHGSIQGAFTCLAHQRDPSQPTCVDLGEFTDFVAFRGDPSKGPGEIQPGLRGTYSDPTVETAA